MHIIFYLLYLAQGRAFKVTELVRALGLLCLGAIGVSHLTFWIPFLSLWYRGANVLGEFSDFP